LPEAQSVEVTHVVPQLALDPVHWYGAHDGMPVVPLPSNVQVPFAEAPSDAAHTSHEPPQPVSQQ
jgi:hypothetical protein